jgi:murein DD-endopeptidase MepM/ murein hydrolase activator NlpD
MKGRLLRKNLLLLTFLALSSAALAPRAAAEDSVRPMGPSIEELTPIGPSLPAPIGPSRAMSGLPSSGSGHEHEFLTPTVTPYIWDTADLENQLAGPPTPISPRERIAGPQAPSADYVPAGPPIPSAETPVAYGFLFPVGGETEFSAPDANGDPGFRLVRGFTPYAGGRDKHMGLDLSNRKQGSTVRALADGIVAMVCDRTAGDPMHTGWGNMVVLAHKLPGGEVVYSLLAHLKDRSIQVRPGERVLAGQPIAEVGSTGHAEGPHLHLEMRKFLGWNALDMLPQGWQHMGFLNPLSFLSNHLLQFPDLPQDHWAYPYVMTLVKLGVLPAGSQFGPDQPVTGLEFAQLLKKAFGPGAPDIALPSANAPLPLASALGTILQALRAPGQGDDNGVRQSFILKSSLEKATGRPVKDFSHGITRAEAAVLLDAALKADGREPGSEPTSPTSTNAKISP